MWLLFMLKAGYALEDILEVSNLKDAQVVHCNLGALGGGLGGV